MVFYVYARNKLSIISGLYYAYFSTLMSNNLHTSFRIIFRRKCTQVFIQNVRIFQ